MQNTKRLHCPCSGAFFHGDFQEDGKLEHFLIETLCVSIHTLPTLRGKSAVSPLAYGAGVRFHGRQSDYHFQWHFALKAVIWDHANI